VSDKAELETEVGAKIAGDILASEDALGAVLEHMKPQQKASLWQRLKRALTSLRGKLKGQKNAKPAKTMKSYLEEEGILPPDTNRNNGKTIFKNGSYVRTAETPPSAENSVIFSFREYTQNCPCVPSTT
jgi:hypothetical protein